MAPRNLNARIAVMRDLVHDIELELSHGQAAPESLNTFRDAIDEIRLRLWVVATGSAPGDQATSLQRARVQRIIDISRSLSADLAAGRVAIEPPALRGLRYAADELAMRVEEHVRRSAGGGEAPGQLRIEENCNLPSSR